MYKINQKHVRIIAGLKRFVSGHLNSYAGYIFDFLMLILHY